MSRTTTTICRCTCGTRVVADDITVTWQRVTGFGALGGDRGLTRRCTPCRASRSTMTRGTTTPTETMTALIRP